MEQDEYVVSDGKLVGVNTNIVVKAKFENSNDVINKTAYITRLIYSFDETYYNNISIETETTINNYNSRITFYIKDYQISSKDSPCYGESYLPSQASSFLDEEVNLVIYDGEKPNCYELYLDKELTQPFSSSMQLLDENYSLYIKLIVPQDKSIVLSIEEYTSNQFVYYVYVVDVGEEFDFDRLVFKTVTSIDGNTNVDGLTSLLCEESKIYVVKCS